jgi:ABC-type multidrug transport system fused ATPase/permease subunit
MQTEIPQSVGKFFWHAWKPFQVWLWLSIAFVGIAAALAQGSSYIFKIITDAVEVGDFQTAMWAGLSYPLVVFVLQSLYRGSGITMAFGQTKAAKYGYDLLIDFATRHSKTFFDSRFTGSLVSKVSHATSGIEALADIIVWTYLDIVVRFVVTGILMFGVSPLAGGVFLALVTFISLINLPMVKKKRELSKLESEAGSELSGKTADLVSNMDAVRQYARRPQELIAIQKSTDKTRDLGFRGYIFSEKIMLLNGLSLFIAFSGIMYIMLLQWEQGKITSGDFVLVLTLLSQLTGTLVFLGQAFQRTARVWGRMDEGLKEIVVPQEVVDAPVTVDLVAANGYIVLNNVSFSYDEKNIFNQLTIDIPSGQRIGLVGPSGAGKSTLVSLLLRQHDINGGVISIDDQNIATVTQDSLRSNIALVPQEPMLFHRTIRENIMYGKPDASEEELVQAAERAQAREFIEALPQKYDTLVGERGVKLSGGQKQRVAIARAMLKDAPILVLDEATSALDSESEVAIQQALEILMENKTVIAVAHRLSTLRKMDRILVIDNGAIVEDGTHDTLAAAGGLYAKLWKHQAGGFLQE